MKKCFWLVLCLFVFSACSAISNINKLPKSKLLISGDIDASGGLVSFNNADSDHNGVSIIVEKQVVDEQASFGIYYFESFPNKPKGMNVQSIAYEFKYEVQTHRRIKIVIPYMSSANPATAGFALFRRNSSSRKWHFAGGVKVDTINKLVYALIDRPGVFALLSSKTMKTRVTTDFMTNVDNFNVNIDLSKKYCNASVAFSHWFYVNKRKNSSKLFTEFSENKFALLLQAAQFAYFETQFTSNSEIFSMGDFSNILGVNFLKTALMFENRPVAVVLDTRILIFICLTRLWEVSIRKCLSICIQANFYMIRNLWQN